VCVPFTAYGSKSGAGTVTCELTKGAGSVPGAVDNGTDPEVWTALFTGGIANTYDAITAALASANDSHANVTVLGTDGCG
jgi:hypothetical protein